MEPVPVGLEQGQLHDVLHERVYDEDLILVPSSRCDDPTVLGGAENVPITVVALECFDFQGVLLAA